VTRVAWFHPFSGAAGDMALAALLDAGADAAAVEAACRRVVPNGWSLRTSDVLRSGLRGCHVEVVVDEAHEDHGHHGHHEHDHHGHHEHRDAAGIIAAITAAGLPDRATSRAVAAFERLAVAEGRLHGIDPAHVTFHEVGAVDSIVDVVGVCVALDLLGVDVVASAPPTVGVGTIRSAHGVLPNPPPAVVEVLAGVPVVGVDVGVELTTPTGAALLATLAAGRFGAMPAMTVQTQGWGAGTKDIPGRANLLQVVLGEAVDVPVDGRLETVVEMSTTLDDVRGEVVGHVVAEALAAGALDAWSVATTMKKGRPGVVLTVLAAPPDADRLRRLVAAETGTLGIRTTTVQRWVADRRVVEVDVDGMRVRLKVGPYRAKVEHDDAVAVARETGRPLQDVVAIAERAYAVASAEASFRQSDR